MWNHSPRPRPPPNAQLPPPPGTGASVPLSLPPSSTGPHTQTRPAVLLTHYGAHRLLIVSVCFPQISSLKIPSSHLCSPQYLFNINICSVPDISSKSPLWEEKYQWWLLCSNSWSTLTNKCNYLFHSSIIYLLIYILIYIFFYYNLEPCFIMRVHGQTHVPLRSSL